ncbi:MAG: DUF896 domain-containing protein [Clostridiales bacterium]|nr:DUF896 domain-containing protein [Clostridiales bacterium]
MEKEKIDRINELARIKKIRPLTESELKEQQALRKEYIQGFRENMEAILQGVTIQEADGSRHPLQKKEDKHS